MSSSPLALHSALSMQSSKQPTPVPFTALHPLRKPLRVCRRPALASSGHARSPARRTTQGSTLPPASPPRGHWCPPSSSSKGKAPASRSRPSPDPLAVPQTGDGRDDLALAPSAGAPLNRALAPRLPGAHGVLSHAARASSSQAPAPAWRPARPCRGHEVRVADGAKKAPERGGQNDAVQVNKVRVPR